MSSSTNTAFAPSFAGAGGGGGGGSGGGKRGRDGRDNKPKPVDKLPMVEWAPDGNIRLLLLALLNIANLGNLPSGSLLTRGGNSKTLNERTMAVTTWTSALLNSSNGLMASKYTELAEAFVHVLRAMNTAGMFDQVVAMLVELLTEKAVAATAAAEDSDSGYDDTLF